MRNVWNYKLYGDCNVRHHLLEIILWPKDGNLIPIINSQDDLKRLGIYDDYKMTIEITNSEHTSMHNRYMNKNRKQKMIETLRQKEVSEDRKIALSIKNRGEGNPMFGKDAWAISCSKKTADEIEATRNSKRSKMKDFWATHPEAKAKMAEKVRLAKLGRSKEVFPHES